MKKALALLPIEEILPDLLALFPGRRNVILSAAPGAGKTTRVPLALLDQPWLSGKKIIMLEPRRIAAQRAALYMAELLDENVGETVGYRIRGDAKIGKQTRLEVVTEGILTRIVQNDPALHGVGLIIFDEFHERSIHADLGLALSLDAQTNLREDLCILVMSATLDVKPIGSILGDASIVTSKGQSYPVTTHYAQRSPEGSIEPVVASAIRRALRDEQGDILVFLPGAREIRRVEEQLLGTPTKDVVSFPPGIDVHLLFGDAPPERQQSALRPTEPGRRKIILATSVAESSLTIDGVRVVIDSGLSRQPRFDPRRGMSGLVTLPVSRASADQRRGRAGRQAPGTCFRLWTERSHSELPEFSQPEILVTDLAPLALELARWGDPEGTTLRFIDPPSKAHLTQARALLADLGALDGNGKLTKHGRELAELPLHPRLGHMIVEGKELGLGTLACDVAALLDERDLLRGESSRDVDLHARWYALRKGKIKDTFAAERARSQAKRLRENLRIPDSSSSDDRLGVLLALAYPERVAKQRDEDGSRYQMASGAGAFLPKGSALTRERYLAIGDVDGTGSEVKIQLAEPIAEDDLREAFGHRIVVREEVRWDDQQQIVVARKLTKLGAIELSESATSASGEDLLSAMIHGIRQMGLSVLPWTKHANSIRTRSEWLRTQGLTEADWPNLSDESLLVKMETWLAPFLNGISKRVHLQRLDMSSVTEAMFSYQQIREIDRLAPTHLTVPTGSSIPVEYVPGAIPVLAVRLQEMFGQVETPVVGGGKIAVVLHLLSPAKRPLAVTQDLSSFWNNAYADVRKDMRGRYPKHPWPENPLEAEPTKRTKRR